MTAIDLPALEFADVGLGSNLVLCSCTDTKFSSLSKLQRIYMFSLT